MKCFGFALPVTLACIMFAPIAVMAQLGIATDDTRVAKPPVGDFGPPLDSNQVQIIDDGPVVHDYRTAPKESSPPLEELPFILYNCCAVVTVRNAEERVETKEPRSKTLILTVHIDEMLSGDLGGRENVVFAVDRSIEGIFANKPCAELCGKKMVLGFRHISMDQDSRRAPITSVLPVLDISNVHEFFAGQKFSKEDLLSLRRHRPSKIYGYTICLELRLDKIRDAGAGAIYPPTSAVDATVLTVLLDDHLELRGNGENSPNAANDAAKFVKGQQFKFRISPEQWVKLFKGKSVSQVVGTECVLSFDCGEKGVEGYHVLYKLDAPFFTQKYSRAEIDDLNAKLADSALYLIQLKSELQSYLENRWTRERIKKFCRLDTRHLPHFQGFVPAFADVVLKGQLYPESEKGLGKTSWYCAIRSGMPDEYQAEVLREKKQYWTLEISRPSPKSFTDDELAKRIVWQILTDCEWAYWFRYGRGKTPGGVLDIGVHSLEPLRHNAGGQVVGISGILDNGQSFSADLSSEFELSSILVNGKPSGFWTKITKQRVENISAVINGCP